MSIDLSSESIAETSVQQFCVEMMKRLDIQRRNEHFCDVILEVGSGDDQARLKAHRIVLCAASPFFYNALNSDMKEKEEGVIRLEETSKPVMEDVLEYLYTGHVDINEQNAFDLITMADYFLLSGLKSLCATVLIHSLSFSNCVETYYFALKYQCPELQQKTRDFIFENFMSVTESENFLNLDMKQVEEWISNYEIRVKGEEEVFQVIVKWMERNEMQERFCELFRHVRLLYLSQNYIFDVILPHPSVKDCETCTTFTLNAMREVANASEECFFSQSPRTCLKTHEDCLVACSKKHTFSYVPVEDKWYLLSKRRVGQHVAVSHGKLYSIRRNSAGLCVMEQYDPMRNTWTAIDSTAELVTATSASPVTFQGSVYYVGGYLRNNNQPTNKVHKYNPDTNTWQELAPMSIARGRVCVVADRNSLYAIGGESASKECLDVVEKFDPEKNCWSTVASTLERKMMCSGTFVRGKVFLFADFTDSKQLANITIEMYDPVTDVWTSIESTAAPKISLAAVCFKGDIIVSGFWGTNNALQHLMQAYNVEKNEWKPCSFNEHRDGSLLRTLAAVKIPRETLKVCNVVSET